MELPNIPDKMYFRIGEVSSLTGIKPSVLRYWETEFGTLRPSKSRSNQRLYTKADIEKVLKLKTLLYEKKFTIAGARRVLARGFDREINELEGEGGADESAEAAAPSSGTLEGLGERVRSLISEVQSIKELLS